MQPASSPDPERSSGRWQRLLTACRKGLNHDLPNQLVALQGLLQLLSTEEAQHLRPEGQDYLRRLLGVAQQTHAMAQTLANLSRLGGDDPPAEMVALPELVEEARASLKAPPACAFDLQAAHAHAPRSHVVQALTVAFRLLAEPPAPPAPSFVVGSRPTPAGIELSLRVNADAKKPPSPQAQGPPAKHFSKSWHERLECVLLQELADCWGGTVKWQTNGDGAAVIVTLPAPR